MLYVHAVHEVRGAAEAEYEAAWREGFLPALADGDDARLLWYCSQVHGTGPAYTVVTVTAVRDGGAWERLAERLRAGDLQQWTRGVDELRHGHEATILQPVAWSPMRDVDLAAVPVTGVEHELSLYMEDTGWPHAALDDYVAFWERGYYRPMLERGGGLLDIQAVWQVAWGAGRRKEAILMQKVVDHAALLRLFETEVPAAYRQPGQFMHDALAYRDRWRSRLLRTSSWSPLF